MVITILDLIYEPSESVVAQGKDVSKYERKGFFKVRGGNGSYRMAKSSKVILYFEIDGVRHSCSVKQLIYDAYGISRVGQKEAYDFLTDLKAGNIKLDFSEDGTVTLAK